MPGTWTAVPTFTVGETTGLTAALNILSTNENYLNNQLSDSGELGAAAASFDITSISAQYTHLLGILTARGTAAGPDLQVQVRLNNDSGSNYNTMCQAAIASGAHMTSAGVAQTGWTVLQLAFFPGSNAPASVFGATALLLLNYVGAHWKSLLTFWGYQRSTTTSDIGSGTGYGNWQSTSAVNRVTILPQSGNFDVGSRFTLYGLY